MRARVARGEFPPAPFATHGETGNRAVECHSWWREWCAAGSPTQRFGYAETEPRVTDQGEAAAPQTHSTAVRLTVTPYRTLKADVRTGIAADFELCPEPTTDGVIYQRVTMSYRAGEEQNPTFYHFTEAWTVTPGSKTIHAIDQKGTDAFMVNKNDVKRFGGDVTIETTAWYETGVLDNTFARGRTTQRWGSLHGVDGHQRGPPDSARPLRRAVAATWRKGGDVRWDTQPAWAGLQRASGTPTADNMTQPTDCRTRTPTVRV